MPISVNGPGTPGPRGPEGPTGPEGTLTANTGISIGGTLETSHIVPLAVDTYDLGNTANFFRNLYIGTGSIYMMSADGKEAKLSMDTDGELSFQRQTRLSLSSNSGKKTKISNEGTTGSSGGTGATGCGSAINFKFGGGTEDSQGFYTKGKFWTVDDANDSGCTFMNMDAIYINNWEDAPCDRNFAYYMQSLPYCGRIDIFPQGFSGANQAWARFFYSGHYGIGGATQSGSSAGYHKFNIDTNHPIHTMNSPSGGSAAFITGNEYEVHFSPMCSEGSDNDDGASGGSGGSSGGDGGSTIEPPAPTYPCIRRRGRQQYQGFTLENGIGSLEGFYALGGSGASGGASGSSGVVNVNTVSEMYVNNFAPASEGFLNDNPFLSSLNQNGRVTLRLNGGGTYDTWVRYNYSAHAVSGGTGDGGYTRFTGMTLDTFGPYGATATSVFNLDQLSNLCFEDNQGVTCNPGEYTFTFRGITNTSPGNTTFTNSIGTGDLWFHDASYDAGATFGQMTDVLFDRWEDDPCNREMGWGAVPYYPLGNLRLYPEDHNGLTSDTWVQYYHMDRNFIGNQEDGVWRFVLDNHPNSAVRAFNGPSGGTAMLEVGKRYHLSFHTETNSDEDNDGGSGGSTAHPNAPAYPCTYRYGATQGATAHRDPGNGFFGVSGASVGYTTLGGGATVADIRSINEMFIDTYAPNGDGARYDGDFLEGLDQTGKITLTRMSGATSEVWARFSYDVHGNSAGTGGFHWFQGVTLDTWGPSGGYTSGSYGDFHIPMERTNVGVVPWKMCFENTAVTGPTASLGTNQFSFHHKVGTADSDPTYGFFKLGGTGAGDSLMEANSLFIDNFEENGEYGTGRYIGDFLDALDNTGTVKITPFGTTAGQQWVKYYYSTEVQGITSSGGSGGYHKILGLSGHSGNYLGSSFGVVPGTSGPYLIEFNETVAMSEDISTFINCPESFDNTGLAYGLYIRPYTTTIESIYLRTGTGGGCTGTVYVGGMQSLPVAGCSGMGVSTTGQRFHSATSGNTFSGGNTVGINQEVFLNLQGFTLAGSTGCPNYVVGSIRIRRTDGS